MPCPFETGRNIEVSQTFRSSDCQYGRTTPSNHSHLDLLALLEPAQDLLHAVAGPFMHAREFEGVSAVALEIGLVDLAGRLCWCC